MPKPPSKELRPSAQAWTFIEQFPEHAKLIGYITAEWSRVEHSLVTLLALSLSTDAAIIRPMIYSIESSKARLEAIRAAFDVLMRADEHVRNEMSGMLDEAAALLVQRNKYAHALYGISGTGELAILSVKKRHAGDLPLHDLVHQHERMKKLSRAVAGLLGAALGMLPPPPQAPVEAPAVQKSPSGTADARTHPSPQVPPPPSPATRRPKKKPRA